VTSPGWRLDHAALTVPRLEEAVAFFTDVVGAVLGYDRSLPAGTAPLAMRESFNAHEDAGFRLAKLYVGGVGLELFEYTAPDQRTDQPRNCDVGGSHLGFLVPDLAAAVVRAAAHPGVRILGEPQLLPAGHPLAGRRWVYLLTPWGQQLELVSDELRGSARSG
jgi:catechol 2,3-dioxygenase-like lactoylglutathione lyase family enzyme